MIRRILFKYRWMIWGDEIEHAAHQASSPKRGMAGAGAVMRAVFRPAVFRQMPPGKSGRAPSSKSLHRIDIDGEVLVIDGLVGAVCKDRLQRRIDVFAQLRV